MSGLASMLAKGITASANYYCYNAIINHNANPSRNVAELEADIAKHYD